MGMICSEECSDGSVSNHPCRNLRKIKILLQEFERTGKHVDYYALDLSLSELQRTFAEVSSDEYSHVDLHGLHGTYDDALAWLSHPQNLQRPTVVMSMGSSIGNFSREGAAEFLARFARLLKPSDLMIIGLDACTDPDKVYKAYNDSKGITQRFYENGLLHANAVLGYEAFQLSEWEVVTDYDVAGGRHRAFYSPKQNITIDGVLLQKGEKLVFEEATKYSPQQREQLWRDANLVLCEELGNSSEEYRKLVLASRSAVVAEMYGRSVD